MKMNRLIAFAVTIFISMASVCTLSARTLEDDYEQQNVAQNWYADRCESIITRFEGLRHDAGELPQKYCLFSHAQAGQLKYALAVSTWDNRMMIMFTPEGDDVTGKIVNKSILPSDIYWESISHLLRYATPSRDITLIQRPIPIRECNKSRNMFTAVLDYEDRVSDVNSYNQMIFKPHQNTVRLTGQHRNTKKDEAGNVIKDEMEYNFQLITPSVVAKMFRGYEDSEMTPWVVKKDFFAGHYLLQFSRWKEGEAIQKATPDTRHIISTYDSGRRIKDTRWLASVESAERSFYAVQFEHQGGDALAAIVCIAEGEVVSTWEFHGSMEPQEYKDGESIWFVDDEGNFMEHAPEIQCVVATECGLELYLRLFGGESVQYYILREVGSVLMTLQTDYWIYVWD